MLVSVCLVLLSWLVICVAFGWVFDVCPWLRFNRAQVFQLETAMGAAIECFPGAGAVAVPRTRFAPVKKCNDLLLLRSDAYVVNEHFNIVLAPERCVCVACCVFGIYLLFAVLSFAFIRCLLFRWVLAVRVTSVV